MYLEAIAPAVEIAAPATESVANRNAIAPLSVPVRNIELSILTYNVRGLPWPVASGRGEALRRIGEELAALRHEGRQPDVVLIQEGFRSEMADLVRTSGYHYWARGPGRGASPTRLTGGGLHVLSDAPILDVQRVAYRDCAGLDCLANKGAMRVRVMPDGAATPVDIVNTHMNSRKASRAAPAEAQAAHNSQMRQLNAFISTAHSDGVPMLVGGDFNVKKAPERYYYDAFERPYTVVSELCGLPGAGCGAGGGGGAPDVSGEPWLRSQDLQAFVADPGVRVRPVTTQTLFARAAGKPGLSDHDGYLVRYQLSWAPQALAYRANDAVVKPKIHNGFGVKVSWRP